MIDFNSSLCWSEILWGETLIEKPCERELDMLLFNTGELQRRNEGQWYSLIRLLGDSA